MRYIFSFLRLIFSWPFVVFVIIIIFKKELSDLLKNFEEFRFGNFYLKLFEKDFKEIRRNEPFDIVASPATDASKSFVPTEPSKSPYEGKYGDLYWSGHDLMWTINAIMIGKDKIIILHGLTKSLQHLGSLGLSNMLPYIKDLETIKSDVENTPPYKIDKNTRKDIIDRMWKIKNYIGVLIQITQKDYEP